MALDTKDPNSEMLSKARKLVPPLLEKFHKGIPSHPHDINKTLMINKQANMAESQS
jgi:hypothetical protein